MISLLTMLLNTLTGALTYALKAFFSLISWFFKSFFKAIKLLFVALPVTCIVFMALLCLNLFILFGNFEPIISNIVDDKEISQDVFSILNRSAQVTGKIFGELIDWWQKSVYVYRGTASYVFLLILTILMFVPVVFILLCFSAISSFGTILFFSAVADAALYLLRTIMGKSFIRQAMDRYYRLFPDAGRKHYEKNYDKWLKKKNREIENEENNSIRRRKASFYEEDYDDYDESYEDYDSEGYDESYDTKKHGKRRYADESYYEEDDDIVDEDYDDYDEEDYEDEDYDVEDYADEDYDDEDFEEDYDIPRSRSYRDDYDDPRRNGSQKESGSKISASSSGTFDFFAGCTTKESADKKYKSLVKLYHPDNMDGDTAALQEINAQYAQIKKRFS